MSGNGATSITLAPDAASQPCASEQRGGVRLPRSGASAGVAPATPDDTWAALADVGAAVMAVMPLRVLSVARATTVIMEVAAALRSGGRLDRRRAAASLDRAAAIIAEANGELSAVIRMWWQQ